MYVHWKAPPSTAHGERNGRNLIHRRSRAIGQELADNLGAETGAVTMLITALGTIGGIAGIGGSAEPGADCGVASAPAQPSQGT
jgi:hypothetical protein